MLKRENLRKNFLRVKQMADQNLGRAEKSEVLSEDLQTIEKRVELVKTVVQITSKKVAGSLQSSAGMDVEKRLRKLPETNLAHSLIENASLLGKESVMGNMFQMCGECESNLASNALQYEIDVEAKVLGPLQDMFDNDLPGIVKCKKQLSKLTLDMDSARSRWNTALKSTQVHGTNMASASAKADTIREEYEDTVTRMGQARDNLATEMYNFISKEAEHSQKLVVLMEVQAEYHRRALEIVKKMLPKMKEALECNPHKPVFGTTLDEHLRVTGRDIALPIEACVLTLLETGLDEEGLFRIAGMASRVKKLKKSFDAGVIDMEDYSMDPHSVAGVLKQFLREMAEPLLTYQLYQEFLQAAQLPQDHRLQALWTSIHNLPAHNYNNFRYLIKFLALLASKSDLNKMTSSNIAIVIGPNLLWSEGDNGPNMLTSGTISNLIESIISHASWFFPEAIDFQQTTRGTAPPRKQKNSEETSTEPVTVPQRSNTPSQSSGGRGCDTAYMTASGGISSRGSDTSSQGCLSSGGSNEVIAESTSPSFHSVSSTEDDIVHSNDMMCQGEGYQTVYASGRRQVGALPPQSSFSSVRLYTNPPALRFNPQDIAKSSPRSDSNSSRSSTPPTPKSGGSVHSDVYSTVFALHSLGDGNSNKGPSEYLSKVRALWDGHMQYNKRPLSTGGITNPIGGGSRVTDYQRRSLGQEVDFGNYALYASSNEGGLLEGAEPSSDHEGSFSSGNQVSSTTGSQQVSLTSLHSTNMNTSTSPTSSTEDTTSVGLAAPLAESEQTSPKIQQRVTRKPAPPPPPNRPFSVAVTASVAKPVQYQTWPRQGGGTEAGSPGGEESTDQVKAPPERPSFPPEKPSHAPHRSSTISHSHADRPSMPPPDRPKVPPPVAPMHQRSASTGSPNSILVTTLGDSPSPQNGQGSLSSSKAAQDLTSIGIVFKNDTP
ncbi:rho GTPase-activating protein 44-like isoform X2 [Mizuhopecten yessoensis]|uniref:rho GTPase-activating protein 44-like isoform X2 n=1 Tax=Mizuhopecten yessoensis TaxID=6573 RepID=UPI000B45DF25|nr:rho GTPase-activating protein 44-like isoform X2 [Mizuhopecten yessoensis]